MIHNMKSNFLNREITTMVRNYMDIGYALNTETMRGSDGTNRVDLRRGKDFIRVWVDRKSAWSYDRSLDEDYNYSGDIFVLRVGHIVLKYPNTDSVWSDNLEVIYEKPYYKIGHGYNKGALTDDFEEVKHWMNVAYPRRRGRYYAESQSISYTDIDRLRIGLNVVKRMPRTKSIHLENIDSISRTYDYGVVYIVHYHTNKGDKRHIHITRER